MTNTIKNCNFLIAFFLGAILVSVLALFLRGADTLAGNAGNLPANAASTTVVAMDQTVTSNPQFATSTWCSARIITTGSSTARIIFDDRQAGRRPAGNIGVLQAASSTVVYPAENYGCNATWIHVITGVSTLTLIETF